MRLLVALVLLAVVATMLLWHAFLLLSGASPRRDAGGMTKRLRWVFFLVQIANDPMTAWRGLDAMDRNRIRNQIREEALRRLNVR